ncbi:MAG: ATP-binding protein [Proteobacteria bacterium]|nr:ATP-binding protein [Pseudomonadota bacterium]
MVRISIKIRVLIVLLLLTLLMIIGMALSMQNGFNKGFFNYRKALDKQFNDNLILTLTNYYENYNSWDGLKGNHRLWYDLLNESAIELEGFQETRLHKDLKHKKNMPIQSKNNNHSRQDKQRSKHLQTRLLPPVILFDKNKHRVIGMRHRLDDSLSLKEIYNDNQLIGYLCTEKKTAMHNKQDELFVKSFKHMLFKIGLLMIIVAIVITFPIAKYFTGLISQITHATKKITAGDFSTRIKSSRKDEIGELANNFNLLAQTLESNAVSQKTMIADIAHELRTPISVIVGEIEAIQDGIHPANDQTINLLHSQISSLKNLVNDLYDLSESDLGSLKYKMTDFDLLPLIKQCINSHQLAFEQKQVDLQLSTTLSHCVIIGDCDRLNQLLNNLLRNSVQYTNQLGKTLITLSENNDAIILIVEDSEPNLTQSQLEKVFDRWYRVEKSRNKNSGGSGLGLAICKEIVKAHNGSIGAELSTLGGIKITIKLPKNLNQ